MCTSLQVKNRGKAPASFLNELIDWAISAPDEIFEVNDLHDVYTNVSDELGPWVDLTHRKAAMLEILRVLGGFESSWNWNCGRDTNNPTSNTPCTEEAGAFQCSGNSMTIDSSLKSFVVAVVGTDECADFIVTTKANHQFAAEYCARLLRFTVTHHGPVKRKEINQYLDRNAMAEFQKFLSEPDTD